MTLNIKIFARHANNIRKTEVLHSEDFGSLSKAQKFCKSWMRGYKYKLCNYFFHMTGEEVDQWMTLLEGDLVQIQEPTLVDEIHCQKDNELSEIEAQIAQISAACSALQRENDELYQTTLKIRDENRTLDEMGQREMCKRTSGFLDTMQYYNTPDSNGRRPLDTGPEPGSLLEGYYNYRATTPNVDYRGPYVTIKMGSCGSGRHNPNTGKYDPNWHGG